MERGDFVSGQRLCEELQVSRTAVWKAVRRLTKEGYHIEAVTNRGYRLLQEADEDRIGQAELEVALGETGWAGHPVVYRKVTGSTNEDIMRLSDQGACEGTLAVADEQTRGKGRRGRSWVSEQGENICMSLLLKPDLMPGEAPMITPVMALSVYEAIMETELPEDITAGIKWPNDVVIAGKDGMFRKVCGILTEMRLEEREIRDVVVGIGINVNQQYFPEEIAESATSLCIQSGRKISRTKLIGRIWRHFEEDYALLLKAGNLIPLKDRYEDALVNRGRAVRVLDPAGEYAGTAQGINETGELIVLRDDTGECTAVGTGEISVRGVMGYC